MWLNLAWGTFFFFWLGCTSKLNSGDAFEAVSFEFEAGGKLVKGSRGSSEAVKWE